MVQYVLFRMLSLFAISAGDPLVSPSKLFSGNDGREDPAPYYPVAMRRTFNTAIGEAFSRAPHGAA